MYATPAVVGDLVYVGSCSGFLFALDRETGRPRWSHDVRPGEQPTSFHGDAVVFDSTFVIGTDGGSTDSTWGEVLAFDLASGRPFWKYSTPDGIISDVIRDGERLYVITRADSLLCLDARSGRLLWSLRGGGGFHGGDFRAPAVAHGRVFFGDTDGAVHALDAESGRSLWKRDMRERVTTSVLALGDGLVVGVASGELHRLRQDTGETEAQLAVGQSIRGTPAMVGDSLIVLAAERSLTCVDRSLTRVVWRRDIPDEISSSRPYLWRGLVLAGSTKGELLALRASDGFPRWSHTLKGVIRGIGTSDRVFYVGTLKGNVYACEAPRLPFGGRW